MTLQGQNEVLIGLTAWPLWANYILVCKFAQYFSRLAKQVYP